MTAALDHAPERVLRFTIFPTLGAITKVAHAMTFAALVEKIRNPKPFPTKAAMPLIVMWSCGDSHTAANCLRHDGNIGAVCGVPGDYDGGVVSLADAATRLADARINAVLYSSPSSTPEKPRWRVLCPTAADCESTAHKNLVGRVNAILGNILAPESFRPAQSYYIGRAETAAHYEFQEVRGDRCIDEAGDITPVIQSGAQTAPAAAVAATDADPVLASLKARGWWQREVKPGTHAIACPWASGHTREDPPGSSASVYLMRNFEGRQRDGFKCLHASCAGRSLRDLRGELGLRGAPTALDAETPVLDADISQELRERGGAETAQSPAPELLQGRQGIKACAENAHRIVRWDSAFDSLCYDEFLDRARINGRDFVDNDYSKALMRLQCYDPIRGIAFSRSDTVIAVDAVAHQRRRNIQQEFIAALPAWDRTERIAHAFCDGWGTPESELIKVAARNFFVALIARAMRPGSKVDTLWCFEGPQGIGKSKALAALAGEIEGEPMHAEIQAAIGSADFYRELRSVWIAELAEMDSLRGREASTIKRVLSALYDRFVEKYEKHARRYLRTAVAVASTNEAAYWQDPSGTRRLVPVPCAEIRIDVIESNRLQWLAEAKALFDAGATWWEFPVSLRTEGENRQVGDPWEDVLRQRMAEGMPSADGLGREFFPPGFVSSAEVLAKWLDLTPSQMPATGSKRLAGVMRRLGYEPAQSGGGKARGWKPTSR